MPDNFEIKYCECGCGQIVKVGRRFILNHQHHKRKHKDDCLCISCKSKRKECCGLNHPMFGKKHSEETKLKIREKRKLQIFSEETRKKLSESRKGHVCYTLGIPHSQETKKKMSLAHLGSKRNETTKKKMSESITNFWSNISDKDKSERIKKCLTFNSPNKQEKYLENLLNRLYPNEWKFVGNGQLIIAGKCPDFVNINGQKKLIELFGDYWHQGENLQDRIDVFKPFGYQTLIIWEKELKDMKQLKRKIFDFCEGQHV